MTLYSSLFILWIIQKVVEGLREWKMAQQTVNKISNKYKNKLLSNTTYNANTKHTL
jgi:hypothetical protein